jgi:predicted DNA-binding ribbon-helix-helix protein
MISSAATPANSSVVVLRMQLPEVWIACISTEARSVRMSGVCSSSIQLNWMFWRVVKWP